MFLRIGRQTVAAPTLRLIFTHLVPDRLCQHAAREGICRAVAVGLAADAAFHIEARRLAVRRGDRSPGQLRGRWIQVLGIVHMNRHLVALTTVDTFVPIALLKMGLMGTHGHYRRIFVARNILRWCRIILIPVASGTGHVDDIHFAVNVETRIPERLVVRVHHLAMT